MHECKQVCEVMLMKLNRKC